jgi:hypothetical protein
VRRILIDSLETATFWTAVFAGIFEQALVASTTLEAP